jgi:DNA-binding transcriptional ArsR family regulator
MRVDAAVRVFRALGDPARQRILALLEQAGELCVSDVARRFTLAQPSVSHHLRVLLEAGLVTAEKRGKETYYALDVAALRRCCGGFFARFACCRPLLRPAAVPAVRRRPGEDSR